MEGHSVEEIREGVAAGICCAAEEKCNKSSRSYSVPVPVRVLVLFLVVALPLSRIYGRACQCTHKKLNSPQRKCDNNDAK